MGLVSYAIFGVVFFVVAKMLNDVGVGRTVYDHTPGVCKEIGGVGDKGSEDIVILRNSPYALISQGLYFPLISAPLVDGKIFLYSLDEPNKPAVALTIVAAKTWSRADFHPSGLSVFEGQPQENPIVFAVNTKMYTVEKFELSIAEAKLTHLKTISDPLFRLVNNVVATSKNSFYLSNFVHSTHVALALAEMAFPVGFGSVVYHDGAVTTQVLSNLHGPNGLTASRDGRYLYVALNLGRAIQVYEISKGKPTELKLVETTPLHSSPDNVKVDENGNLWTGAQPVVYRALLGMVDAQKYPHVPSQVLKITLKAGRTVEKIEEVYADSGRTLRCTSSAIAKGKRLLVGTVMHKALSCELP